MFCPYCGQNNADEASVCAACGASLSQPQPRTQPQPAYQQPVYQQPVYQQPVYQQPANNYAQPASKPGQGMAVASMVLGIVSLFCFAIITGILAIIFGGVAKSKGNKSGMATAGIVLGVIGIALYIIMLVAMPSFFDAYAAILDF